MYKEIYNDPTISILSFIEECVATIPGWTPADQPLSLFILATTHAGAEGNILEIGSCCGRSTAVLAKACQISGQGKVQSIDLFPEKDDWFQNEDSSWSFRTMGHEAYVDQTVWNEPFQKDIAPLYQQHNGIYEILQESLHKFKLTAYVDCYRGTSELYFKSKPTQEFRMAFLDGDHSFAAVSCDIQYALSHMPHGGWLCFDDAFSTYEGVNKAIQTHVWTSSRTLFAQQLTRKLHIERISPC